MKGAVVAAIILVILLLLTGLNTLYLRHTALAFSTMVSALPDKPEATTAEDVRQIQDHMKKKEPLILLTITQTEVDRINELLISLELSAEENAILDYRVTKSLLLDSVEDIARSERIRFF